MKAFCVTALLVSRFMFNPVREGFSFGRELSGLSLRLCEQMCAVTKHAVSPGAKIGRSRSECRHPDGACLARAMGRPPWAPDGCVSVPLEVA